MTSYKSIFASTALFGSVHVVKAIIGIIKNKLIAVLLGAEGIGLIGVYDSIILFLQTGAGLGISQSSVRDIAEERAIGDEAALSRTVRVTKYLLLITGGIGLIVAIITSPLLKHWFFKGNSTSYIIFLGIGIIVCFNIIAEGFLGILKGLRQLKALALANIVIIFISFFSVITLYALYGEKGIIPQLIIASSLSVFVAFYFVQRIHLPQKYISSPQIKTISSSLLKMGTALMLITLLQTVVTLVLTGYIKYYSGLEVLGYYSVGYTLTNTYFGIIISSLMTDYYPRIAAINKDNDQLQLELNKQSAVSLVLCCPLVIAFIVFMPILVKLFYTEDFLPTIDYLKYAMYGVLITVCSNQVDMILVAKYKIKIFTVITIIYRLCQLVLSILLFHTWGLVGLGVAVLVMGILHMLIMITIVNKLYKIRFNKFFFRLAICVLLLSLLASFTSEITNLYIRYGVGVCIFMVAIIFSLRVTKKIFDFDLIYLLTTKFKK